MPDMRWLAVTCSMIVSAGCTDDGSAERLVSAAEPETPDVGTMPSEIVGNVREFRVTAQVFQQQLEAMPLQTAEVWGYNGSTPGPTAVAYEGETIRFIVTNELPEPTTVHFHGMHEPNESDGVPGISQPKPIMPGETYTYEFTPGHAGVFAYHSHTDDAKQELKGLAGFFVILPQKQPESDRVDRHFLFALQEFYFTENGQPVDPMPPGGEFNTFTINGKTLDAASPLPVRVGERIRISLYNASQDDHSMHEHGADMTLVSRNGHEVPRQAREVFTTVDLGPGNFMDLDLAFDKPGRWIFHCHFPHHTSNQMKGGPEGGPVGMSRVFEVTE